MNWYKKAQTADMSTLIVGWLRSARDQDVYVPDLMNNMDSLSGWMADPDESYQAAQQASVMVANEQGGQLTMTQQNLLNQIAANVSAVPEVVSAVPEVME